MIIRNIEKSDIRRLLEIYSYYVLNTAVSYEYVTPTADEFERRIDEILSSGLPYLIAEDNGIILGYCYAHKFHSREAYKKCVETTVYIDKSARKSGIGRALYSELENRLSKSGITNLYACVAYIENEDEYLTHDSVLFHQKMGFEICGHLHRCGIKFDRYYDMLYMEKIMSTR